MDNSTLAIRSDTKKKLKVFCAETGQDMKNFVSDLVEGELKNRERTS